MVEIESNYFTIVEEHFRAARGTGMFLLSPLDLALVEAWKNGGIPIEAVLRGIDVTFEKWRRRPARGRTQMVNSISYCAQSIAAEAQAMADAAPTSRLGLAPPFSIEEVRAFVGRNAAALREAGYYDLANSLEALDVCVLYRDCEKLERDLMQVEEELIQRLRAAESEEMLFKARRA